MIYIKAVRVTIKSFSLIKPFLTPSLSLTFIPHTHIHSFSSSHSLSLSLSLFHSLSNSLLPSHTLMFILSQPHFHTLSFTFSTHHLVVYLVEVDFAYFVHNVLALESDEAETWERKNMNESE